MSLAMTRAQREAFLAETRLAVISVAEDGRAPLQVPVWYAYEPGGVVRIATGATSKKAALLRRAGRMSLCVQTEAPPYKYVTVEGPVTIGPRDHERDIRQIALRYLGAEMGEAYLQVTAAQNEEAVLVTLMPERWMTVDYSKML
jgi:PPOX class probable F420-dependent enzyme